MTDDSFDEPTPVGDPSTMLGRLERRLDERITHQGKRFGAKLDEHSKELTEFRVWKAGLVGDKGDNGRVGSIAKDVHSIRSWVRAAIAGAASAIIAIIVFAARAGETRGYERAEFKELQADIAELQAEREQDRVIRQQLLVRLLQLAPGLPVPTP